MTYGGLSTPTNTLLGERIRASPGARLDTDGAKRALGGREWPGQ